MSVWPNLVNFIHQIRSDAPEQPQMLEMIATFKTGGTVRPNQVVLVKKMHIWSHR
jgi:hypothetical protein